jgi:phage terminase small subunit
MTKLTPKEENFCREYLIDCNATASYKRAGYAARSEGVTRKESHQLLTRPHIQARLIELRSQQQERTQITADKVLTELSAIAFGNISDAIDFDNDGITLRSSEQLTRETIAAIAEVTIVSNKDGIIKTSVKMHDKIQALTQLMKFLGLTSDFNSAIATLKKYGLIVSQKDGKWTIEEV